MSVALGLIQMHEYAQFREKNYTLQFLIILGHDYAKLYLPPQPKKTLIITSPMKEPSSEAPKVERAIVIGVAKIRTDFRQLQGDMFFATGGRRLIGFDLHAGVQDWGDF